MDFINTFKQDVKVFARTIESEAVDQIQNLAKSTVGKDTHIRIMPDAHAGKGCTIGTTMRVTDKICPNLVGVDIGCGITLVSTDIVFEERLKELDEVIYDSVPHGNNVHEDYQLNDEYFQKLRCWEEFDDKAKDRAKRSLGTLGSGNHYIEGYSEGFLSVHSGSRNLGVQIANHYQKKAERDTTKRENQMLIPIKEIPELEREAYFQAQKKRERTPKELCWLEGQNMADYLHDMKLAVEFAEENRMAILNTIVKKMNGKIFQKVNSTHNYIDEKRILRKGATNAEKDNLLLIPLNMRDGVLICKGRGNEDWNNSAPHGAGRLYSRTEAKARLSITTYWKHMEGIYSSCINPRTLDESPSAYKDAMEIIELINPTVEILKQLHPIYNFKAN